MQPEEHRLTGLVASEERFLERALHEASAFCGPFPVAAVDAPSVVDGAVVWPFERLDMVTPHWIVARMAWDVLGLILLQAEVSIRPRQIAALGWRQMHVMMFDNRTLDIARAAKNAN